MIELLPPGSDEYPPFYSDYIQRASQRDDLSTALTLQPEELHAALERLTDEQAYFRPGHQEWSIKEVIGHLTDVERVFSYRLLRISRGDVTPLPGFEQDDYVHAAGFNRVKLSDLLCEFEYLRGANILAIRNLTPESMDRRGITSGMTVSTRALVFMLVGHVDHHLASLNEKYIPFALKK